MSEPHGGRGTVILTHLLGLPEDGSRDLVDKMFASNRGPALLIVDGISSHNACMITAVTSMVMLLAVGANGMLLALNPADANTHRIAEGRVSGGFRCRQSSSIGGSRLGAMAVATADKGRQPLPEPVYSFLIFCCGARCCRRDRTDGPSNWRIRQVRTKWQRRSSPGRSKQYASAAANPPTVRKLGLALRRCAVCRQVSMRRGDSVNAATGASAVGPVQEEGWHAAVDRQFSAAVADHRLSVRRAPDRWSHGRARAPCPALGATRQFRRQRRRRRWRWRYVAARPRQPDASSRNVTLAYPIVGQESVGGFGIRPVLPGKGYALSRCHSRFAPAAYEAACSAIRRQTGSRQLRHQAPQYIALLFTVEHG
jgi:hypothetical protein